MRVVCVDANVLLHCDSLQFLPWGQVLQDPNILVVIVPCVAREIDRLKVVGPAQVQVRARRASRLLRKVFVAHESTIALRASNPKLSVELAATVDLNGADAAGAANHHADERILTEMLALGYNKSALVLLTNDTVAAIKARELGVQAELIPEEWLLAPEPGGAERAIEKLRLALQKSAPARPRLALMFEDREGARIDGALELHLTRLTPLSAAEVEACMAAVAAAHPYSPRLKALSQSQLMRSVYGEAGRTYEQLYSEYIADCRRILDYLSELVGLTRCKGEFKLLINNVGSMPVKDLTLDVSIAPGQWLLGTSAFLNSAIDMPACPASGQDEIKYPHAGIEPARGDAEPAPEGAGFHWHKPAAAANHREAAAVCDEFRQGDSRRFAFVVELARLGAADGEITVNASAKNLDEPVSAILPLRVVTQEMSRQRAIEEGLIRGELAQILTRTVALN